MNSLQQEHSIKEKYYGKLFIFIRVFFFLKIDKINSRNPDRAILWITKRHILFSKIHITEYKMLLPHVNYTFGIWLMKGCIHKKQGKKVKIHIKY